MLGQTISHYEVLDELGHGAMGTVYRARDTRLDRILALKVLRGEVANPTRERRFIQEARTASSLNHPSIVTIYEIFHVDEAPCIAMEYVDGETLEQHLEKGPLEFRQGLAWAIAIADALATAHAAGIVHRDVKPSNIMITQTGLVKILDFGLAKLTQMSDGSSSGERLTLDDRIVGTPPYLSPEQALCEKVDARSDIFSLGAVMYEMFTGKRPFERASNVEMLSAVVKDEPKKLRSVAPDLPAKLEKIVAQCLEKKVERRYQRMEDVKNALEDLQQTDTHRETAGHARLRLTPQPQNAVACCGSAACACSSGRSCLVESQGKRCSDWCECVGPNHIRRWPDTEILPSVRMASSLRTHPTGAANHWTSGFNPCREGSRSASPITPRKITNLHSRPMARLSRFGPSATAAASMSAQFSAVPSDCLSGMVDVHDTLPKATGLPIGQVSAPAIRQLRIRTESSSCPRTEARRSSWRRSLSRRSSRSGHQMASTCCLLAHAVRIRPPGKP